eukprot:gene25221-10866_t
MDWRTTIEYLIALPGILALIILLCPIGRSQIRSLLAPHVATTARSQVPTVLWFQGTFRRPNRDWMVKASAWTVTVDFYVLILPALYFSGLRLMAMSVVSGMALVTYATCGLKDLMCSPRPIHAATPEQRKALLIHCAMGEDEGSPLGIALYILSALWAVWIAVSRIYLGVHTPVDLVWGGACGLTFFALARLASQPHLNAVLTGGQVFGYTRLLIDAWALLMYPKPRHYTTSSLYAVTFLGAWSGFNISYSGALPSVGTLLAGLVADTPIQAVLAQIGSGPLAIRMCVGLVTVAATRVLTKAILQPLLPLLFRLLPSPLRRTLQPPISIKWLHATGYDEAHPEADDSQAGCAQGAVDAQAAVSPQPTTTQVPPKTSSPPKFIGDPTESRADGNVLLTNRYDFFHAILFTSGFFLSQVPRKTSSPPKVIGDPTESRADGSSAMAYQPTIKEGWAVRADGYPLDADFWRRYLSYGALTIGIVEYDRLIEAALAAAAGST